MEIKNKVAIVTGASFGIGLATARLLTKQGAKVVLAARSHKKLENISKELPNSFPVSTDMTKEDEIKSLIRKTVDRFGRIDILINNAGQGYDATLEKIDLKTYHQLFNLNVVGPLIAMQLVIPVMRSQKNGVIINVSSGLALMNLPGTGGYTSLKRALVSLSHIAREELAEDRIKVGVAYPYVTLTDFEKNTIKHKKPGNQDEDWIDNLPHPPDTAQYAAAKIIEAIKTEKSEVFAHDWMKKLQYQN